MREALLFIGVVMLGCRHGRDDIVQPEMLCDTANVAYMADIVPILQSRCAIADCHVPGGDGTGDFTTYAGLLSQVQNGNLLQAVQHLPGAIPMPPSGEVIPTCEIAHIVAWVNAGAEEN